MGYKDAIDKMMKDAGYVEPSKTTVVNVTGPATIKAPDSKSEPPRPNVAPSATPDVGSASNAAFMATYEPADFIEASWAKFVLERWDQMDDTPAVLLAGPRGTGKTLLAIVYAHRAKRPLLVVNCHPEMTAESLLGTPRLDMKDKGGDYFQPGPVMLAAQHNAILLLDEINALSPAVQLALNPLLDGVQGGMYIPYIAKRIKWDDPRVLGAMNEGYAGTRELQPAFRDRVETVFADYLAPDDERRLIVGRTGVQEDLLNPALDAAQAIRGAARGEDPNIPPLSFDLSPRALLSYARRVVAGQDMNEAWKESVMNRAGYSMRSAGTRETLKQISRNIGGFAV